MAPAVYRKGWFNEDGIDTFLNREASMICRILMSKKRSLWLGPLLVLTVVLVLVTRSALSWRPALLFSLPYDTEGYSAFAISSDGQYAAGSSRGHFVVRALSSGEVITPPSTQVRKYRYIKQMAFSQDNKLLALTWWGVLSNKATAIPIGVSVWDRKGNFREMEQPPPHGEYEFPAQVRFSPDQKFIWMVTTDRLLTWNLANGKLVYDFVFPPNIDSFDSRTTFLSPNCEDFYMLTEDRCERWLTGAKKRLSQYRRLSGSLNVIFAEDEPLIFSDLIPGGVFNANTGKESWRHPRRVQVVAHGTLVRMVEHELEVWNVKTGVAERKLPKASNSRPRAIVGDVLYSLDNKGQLFRQRLR